MIDVFAGGPYNIGGSFLSVQRWTPDFFPSTARITKVASWVKLTELPLHHYNDNSLYAIASCIGNPLKLDHQTSLVSRGKYARVCIEIDTDQPLIPSIGWKRFDIKVEYESIPLICMHCGKVGHSISSCPVRPSKPAVAETEPMATGEEDITEMRSDREEEKIFGEWMVPRPRGNRRTDGTKKTMTARKPSGDRGQASSGINRSKDFAMNTTNNFNVLYEEERMEEVEVTVTETERPNGETTQPTEKITTKQNCPAAPQLPTAHDPPMVDTLERTPSRVNCKDNVTANNNEVNEQSQLNIRLSVTPSRQESDVVDMNTEHTSVAKRNSETRQTSTPMGTPPTGEGSPGKPPTKKRVVTMEHKKKGWNFGRVPGQGSQHL
ncbi:hypothetical protein LINGRAHAP2_LOCUS11481 [Linum grandiflorum]